MSDKHAISSGDDLEVGREQDIGPSTPLGRRLVRHVVGFGVGVGVGLAPYLGLLDVPLFKPLLSLIPFSIRDDVIPLSAALMGIIAVVVQWYGGERVTRRGLRKMFARTLFTAALTFVLLTVMHTLVVRSLQISKDERLSFIVGFNRPNRPPCTAEVSDETCIKRVTLDPVEIESFWGGSQVRLARLALTFSYLLFTGSFGGLVGLIVLREGLQTRRGRTSR